MGGSAWQYEEESRQYYLHLFSQKQPDLNWENEEVRNKVYDMMNFWIDKGISGFRMDVIELIGKIPDEKITSNGPKLHEYIKEMNKKTFGGKDLLTVGETWGSTIEIAKQYSNPDDSELSMIFQFEHIMLDQQPDKEKWDLKPLDLLDLKTALSRWQIGLEGTGWNSLFWNNHDLPRIVSRWGNDKEYRVESAKMLATLLHGMKGTPYIYQGEELGMTNVRFESLDEYKDIESLNMYKERIKKGYSHEEIMESIYAKGRDNARTPMQWDDGENAGFTIGEPWIKVNTNYKEINAKAQLNDENSIFNYYKKLIKIRKENPVVVYGRYDLILEENKEIFAYTRTIENEQLLVICNFTAKNTIFKSKESIEFKHGELLISNYNVDVNESINNIELKPYECRFYKLLMV